MNFFFYLTEKLPLTSREFIQVSFCLFYRIMNKNRQLCVAYIQRNIFGTLASCSLAKFNFLTHVCVKIIYFCNKKEEKFWHKMFSAVMANLSLRTEKGEPAALCIAESSMFVSISICREWIQWQLLNNELEVTSWSNRKVTCIRIKRHWVSSWFAASGKLLERKYESSIIGQPACCLNLDKLIAAFGVKIRYKIYFVARVWAQQSNCNVNLFRLIVLW